MPHLNQGLPPGDAWKRNLGTETGKPPMRIVLLLSALWGLFLLPSPRGGTQSPPRQKDPALHDILAGHARDLMKALGGRRRALTGGNEKLRAKLETLQISFIQRLRAWRKAHPGSPGADQAAFEEARAWRSLGKDEEARKTLEALGPRGLSPRNRLLAGQWLAELGAPPSRAHPLLEGLAEKDLPSFREKFLLAALLSREPGREEEALHLLGGLGPSQGEPDPARVRSRVEDLERALPGLPQALARPLRALLYKEWIHLLPGCPDRPRLEEILAGLRLKPGDPLPRLQGKDPAGKPFTGWKAGEKPLLLLFWESRNPGSLQALKEAAALARSLHGRFTLVTSALDKRRRDLEAAVKELPPGVPVLWDGKGWDGSPARAFAVNRVPFTVLADSQGRILALGLTGKRLEEKIKKLISGP